MYKGHLCQRSNGKGLTELFAIASGYAEMYERYCNKIDYLSNPFIIDKVLNIHYKNNGYYLDKNEKLLTFEEAIQYDQEYLKCTEGDNPGLLKYYLSTIYNNKFIGIPYKNILSESDIIYYDPRFLP